MTTREVLERLMHFVLDGRSANEQVLVKCDGKLRTIEAVQTKLAADGDPRPRDVFVLLIADGPAGVSEISPTTLRSGGRI